MFTAEQIQKLSAPLDGSKVKTRSQGKTQLSYLEGWQVIDFANEVFGFDGWNRETVLLQQTSSDLVVVKKQDYQTKQWNEYEQWRVSYIAKVKITVGQVVREGTGFGSGMGKPEAIGDAIEGAVKEAETDAMKRALMTFGYGFGLALYDKTQANVDNGSSASAQPRQQPASRPAAKPVSTYDAPAQAQALTDDAKRDGLTKEDLIAICTSHNLPLGPSKFRTKSQVDTFAGLIQDAIAAKENAA